MSENPYKILGIAEDATTEEIRAAWKKKAAATHPDKEGGNAAEFARAAKAFEDLAKRREEIDSGLRQERARAAAQEAQETRRREETFERENYKPRAQESTVDDVLYQLAGATKLAAAAVREVRHRVMSAPGGGRASSISAKEHELGIVPCSDGGCGACYGAAGPAM